RSRRRVMVLPDKRTLAAVCVLFAVSVGCQIHQATGPELAAALGRGSFVGSGAPPSGAQQPLPDPQFVASVRAFSFQAKRLPPIPENADQPALYSAIERLAQAIERVPASYQVGIGLGDAADRVRISVSNVAFGFRETRGHLALVKRALAHAAFALYDVSVR